MIDEKLYFAVRPAKSDSLMVLEDEVLTCGKCGKEVTKGRLFFKNGLCYKCEHKRLLSEAYRELGRSNRLDKEFNEVVSQ